jgi:hypothetical protein
LIYAAGVCMMRADGTFVADRRFKEEAMTGSHRGLRAAVVLLALSLLVVPSATPRASAEPNSGMQAGPKVPPLSGIYEYSSAGEPGDVEEASDELRAQAPQGALATDCPQAGLQNTRPQPLDGPPDQAERVSRRGDDIRLNQDFSCFPQNETSIAVNPTNARNLVGGANDYRLGFGSSGFYASTDGGRSWYDGILPFPSLPNGDNLDGGGDPVIVFDRDGTVYYLEINFNRTDDTNGVFVLRSTDGGFTWSRPCVPITPAPPVGNTAVCGGTGDVRQPGDGVVSFQFDDDTAPNGSIQFDDKPWMTAGPRPAGVAAECFGPVTKTPVACAPGTVGPDRLYVTWTRFADDSQIYLSYSDDGARSWSAPRSISGSAPFCIGGGLPDDPNACNFNQFSVPSVNPTTGALYVARQNFNTPAENQYLVTSSLDGGRTFGPQRFVSLVYDQNYPRSGVNRPDCTVRGQQTGRAVLTNSCFRVNSGGNIVVDKRGGAFADDLYVVFSDNRNGTADSSNVDVFLFTSTDGGATWIGPTRVNDDRSDAPEDYACAPGSPGCLADYGRDQWFPWVDINADGELNVVFNDRRLDEDSTDSEWPQSRTLPGNYLAWLFGAQCTVTAADSRECAADEAVEITQPTGPVTPAPGPQPGQGQASFPLSNLTVSDVPSNYDYSFRAGIFMGDYNNVTVTADEAIAFWTDARNGRSSRSQVSPGRNPICEQSDVFADRYAASGGGSVAAPARTDDLFLVTPCP